MSLRDLPPETIVDRTSIFLAVAFRISINGLSCRDETAAHLVVEEPFFRCTRIRVNVGEIGKYSRPVSSVDKMFRLVFFVHLFACRSLEPSHHNKKIYSKKVEQFSFKLVMLFY